MVFSKCEVCVITPLTSASEKRGTFRIGTSCMRGIRQLFCAFWAIPLAVFTVLTAVESAAAPIKPAVEKVRVQTFLGYTRIVLETNAPIEPNLFTLGSPDRLVIDLPELQWRVSKSKGAVNSQLVKEFNFGLFQPGVSRLILRLSSPARIVGRTPRRSGSVFLYQIDLADQALASQWEASLQPGIQRASMNVGVDALPIAQTLDQKTKTAFADNRFDPEEAEFSILSEAIQDALDTGFAEQSRAESRSGIRTAALTPGKILPPADEPENAAPAAEDEAAEPPAKESPPPPQRRLRIVLDPGHGGIDPGTGSDLAVQEKDINLAFALELAAIMAEDDRYEVFLTREKDVRVRLPKRVQFARQKNADLFISIHADWADNESAEGATAYTLSEKASVETLEDIANDPGSAGRVAGVNLAAEREDVARLLVDLARRETQSRSLKFAELVIEEVSKETKVIHRPIRRNSFHVLKAPDMPSVLLELGFVSNANDLTRLTSFEWRQKTGHAVKRAIDRWRAATVTRDFANR